MLEIEDDKTSPGTIIQEIQSGYMFSDRLLRPSFVGISKKKGKKHKKHEITSCRKLFRPHIKLSKQRK